MLNPFQIMFKNAHLIAGYVIDVKQFDRFNVITLRRDRANRNSGILSVQAWRDNDVDYQKLTNNIKGEFITGLVVPGGAYEGHECRKLRTLIVTPKQKAS